MLVHHHLVLHHACGDLRLERWVRVRHGRLVVVELLAIHLPVGARVRNGRHCHIGNGMHAQLGPIELRYVGEANASIAGLLLHTCSEYLSCPQFLRLWMQSKNALLYRDGHEFELSNNIENVSCLFLGGGSSPQLLLSEHVQHLVAQCLVLTTLALVPIFGGGSVGVCIRATEKEVNVLFPLVHETHDFPED